jgi:antirestriction protein ArdC
VTLDNSAAYLQSWLTRLREDARLLVIAAAQAQKAADCILGVSALSRDSDVKRTRLAGFEAHLAKPFDYDVLAGVLERAFWGRHP